jgi:arsenate reductase
MAVITIYHNPSCSKSRGALEILCERGVEVEVHEYLERPAKRADLEYALARLPDTPAELVRKDKRFKELGLDANDYVSADSVIDLLIEHPELMQRPIVIRGDRAIIARPSEKVAELIEDRL